VYYKNDQNGDVKLWIAKIKGVKGGNLKPQLGSISSNTAALALTEAPIRQVFAQVVIGKVDSTADVSFTTIDHSTYSFCDSYANDTERIIVNEKGDCVATIEKIVECKNGQLLIVNELFQQSKTALPITNFGDVLGDVCLSSLLH
jgi:hypothetical protein